MVAPAAALDGEAFKIACEDARRRRLTSVPSLRSYLRRFARPGRPGVSSLRDLLDAFVSRRTILETNGRRWHDDANDYEHDNEKWSVPGRHGYRIVLATWDKVTRRPAALLAELEATLGA